MFSVNFQQIRHAFRRVIRFASHDGGLAAVEFSLILPIMVVLWIGGVEVTQGLSVDRRLNNLASAIGDLAARTKQLTWGDVDQIFDIAPGAMYPYCKTEAACNTAGLRMRITAVNMNGSNPATGTVAWSRAQGTTAYSTGQNMNSVVPVTLRVANSQIIVAEVFYTYRPAVGYVITGNLDLDDRMFFVPRLTAKIALCQTSTSTNCPS